jgi:hypothetical protein
MDNIRPLTTLTNVTPSQVIPSAIGAGVIPVGNYKGQPAFWDLDKAVNQPLVWAEQQHILGNIDGAGLNGIALMTVTAAVTAGLAVSGTITVPAGQVWFLNAVVATCLADATGTIVFNWRCSLFTDVLANALGGLFHTAWIATPLLPQQDEFGIVAPVLDLNNKPTMLRLPAGTTISGQLMNAIGGAIPTGVVGTFQLFGYIGKALVA